MTDRRDASLTQVVLVALLPALVYSIGTGAIVPVLPTVAASMGAGIETAGFIAGALMIGQTIGNIPAGPVVARFGERAAMLASAGVAAVGVLVAGLATTPVALLAGVLVVGFSGATFNLARHAFLTSYAPLRYRARVLSSLGGTYRAGWFVGPLISAAVIAATGVAQSAVWVFVACIAIVLVVLVVVPDTTKLAPGAGDAVDAGGAVRPDARPEAQSDVGAPDAAAPAPAPAPRERTNVWSVIAAHRGVLARLGVGAGLLSLLRAARNVVLPLWALSIGMDDAATALVMGVAGGVDFALFFTSGWVMDRFGRVWAAVPAMLGMGMGLLALAFTHDVADPQAWFWGLAVGIGLANGLGSGILMTLGADLAPREHPAPFLGAWHLITDAASAAVPFVVAGVTALASISVTVGTLGVLGLVGAGMLLRWIPRYVPPPRHRT